MPSRGIHHIDLAVTDAGRSLAFYLDLLGPLGWEESVRYPSYRGTEEVDEAHARCVARGATVHFPPEEDRDEPGYYAFFVFDPDGIRVEVFCWAN